MTRNNPHRRTDRESESADASDLHADSVIRGSSEQPDSRCDGTDVS